MTHNVLDSCVPTFILAGQSNTLGHNIEARDLPPWLLARARVNYGGAFVTATDAITMEITSMIPFAILMTCSEIASTSSLLSTVTSVPNARDMVVFKPNSVHPSAIVTHHTLLRFVMLCAGLGAQ